MTTDTATALTRQQVAGILKKAGFIASSQGTNGQIGYGTRSFGYSVTENGERVYICKSCRGRSNHRSECRTKSGAAKNWRSHIEKDGTVTVTIHGSTSSLRNDSDDVRFMAEQVADALSDAGLKVEQSENGMFNPTFTVSA